MIPSMLNQSLDETNKCELPVDKSIFASNDKIQEELANKLRSLIANFCDEHFVKYLKDHKNDTNKSDAEHPAAATDTTHTTNNTNSESDNKTNTSASSEKLEIADEAQLETNNIEMAEIESASQVESSSKQEMPADTNTAIKDSELNLTSTSSLTPPRSSYSSTSSSSSSSSPSSDNAITNSGSEDANKSLNDHDTESSSSEDINSSPESTHDKPIEPTSLNDVIDKLEIIDHASKSVKEISSSAELNHHRLQNIVLEQLKEKSTENSALEKLWTQILIGADKLEIFGSIHVRSNNVRLFSCLIDEQLHIDNQNFSSASSCVSQDSCSSKVVSKHNTKQNSLRSKNYYKYERALANNNHFYRRANKHHHDPMTYKRYNSLHKKSRSCMQICCMQNDQNLFDLEHQANYNHYYQMKRQHKQQKLAKKVEDIAKATSQEEANKHEHYPMKKFKAYHSYCSNKRKSDIEAANDKQLNPETNDKQEVTSLSSLATVAAAAMRLSPAAESTPPVTNPVKKSRKSSVTNSIKQVKPIDDEIEIDDEEDLNNSLIIDQSNGKLNDFYLYEGEEDFGDSSSIISGSSSFTSSRHSLYEKSNKLVDGPAKKHHNNHRHRQHSAHSHCSSYMSGEHEGLSSRSTSLTGDCMSRSLAKIPTKIATAINHRSVSPASSLASSSFDYDDEQVYQSYCSTSSFKSDFEDDYQNDEFPRKHHSSHRRKSKTKELVNDENDKPDNANSQNVTTDEIIEDNNKPEDQRIAAVNPNSRHYHRRKQHLMDADLHQKQSEIDEAILKKQFKTEKEQVNEQPIHMQQSQLKLQQLPKLLGLQQQQHQELQAHHHHHQQQQQQQQEEASRKHRETDDYLARKYKYNRRFAPYNSTGNSQQANNNINSSTNNNDSLSQLESSNNNLYLLASSRMNRMNQAESAAAENAAKQQINGQYQNGQANNVSGSTKLMSVNSLVDRLSPISDPDMERANGHLNQKNSDQSKLHHHQNESNSNAEIHMLNRINNLSPSSSSSSSSSNKPSSQLGQIFHHNSLQQSHSAAAVIAAAQQQQQQASSSSSGSSPHSHHMSNSAVSHHHAQSVAALLANMQHNEQSHNSQDVAKVLAATLNPHHHMNQHNHHTQQIINRFSSNPTQSELMAAVLAQQQQQQQQQQQHRALIDSGNQFNMNPNGQLYSRYSSHLNAAVAAAAAAAASSAAVAANGHSNRRAHSVESDAHTPSPPATTPANHNGSSNGQLSGSSSLSSSSSSSSSTSSENYMKYNMHDRDEICKKERSSSVNSHSNDPNGSGNEKVRLVPGFDVYISTNDLNACNDDRGSATRLLRNLMDVFFDKSTLAKSSINGTGRITNTLDKHIISSLFAYVKNRYQDVPHSQLTRAATDKCVQTRRNFRKKIKAAQSYFGMFPSM